MQAIQEIDLTSINAFLSIIAALFALDVMQLLGQRKADCVSLLWAQRAGMASVTAGLFLNGFMPLWRDDVEPYWTDVMITSGLLLLFAATSALNSRFAAWLRKAFQRSKTPEERSLIR